MSPSRAWGGGDILSLLYFVYFCMQKLGWAGFCMQKLGWGGFLYTEIRLNGVIAYRNQIFGNILKSFTSGNGAFEAVLNTVWGKDPVLVEQWLVEESHLHGFLYYFLYCALGGTNGVSHHKRQIFIPLDVIPFISIDITQQANYMEVEAGPQALEILRTLIPKRNPHQGKSIQYLVSLVLP